MSYMSVHADAPPPRPNSPVGKRSAYTDRSTCPPLYRGRLQDCEAHAKTTCAHRLTPLHAGSVGWVERKRKLPQALMGFAEFTIGPARGRTRWLNPSYLLASVVGLSRPRPVFRTASRQIASPGIHRRGAGPPGRCHGRARPTCAIRLEFRVPRDIGPTKTAPAPG